MFSMYTLLYFAWADQRHRLFHSRSYSTAEVKALLYSFLYRTVAVLKAYFAVIWPT